MNRQSRGGKYRKGSSMFFDILRKFDMLGININMTYQGEYTFKTLFGAVLSIMVALVLTMFVGYKINILFTRSDAKTSKQSFVQKLAEAPPLFLHKEGFKFAFTLSNPIEPEYGSVKFSHVNITSFNSSSNGRVKITTLLPFDVCTMENFGMNENEFFSSGLSTFSCVNSTTMRDLPIAGDYFT